MTMIRSIWRRLHSQEGARGRRWERRQEQQAAPPAPVPDRPAAAEQEQAQDIVLDVEQLLEELRAHRASIIARIAKLEMLRRPKPTRPPDELDRFLADFQRRCEQPMKAVWTVNKDLKW